MKGKRPASSASKKARLQNKDEEFSEGENDKDTKKKLNDSEDSSDGDELDGETVDEARLRLAKEYLKVQNHANYCQTFSPRKQDMLVSIRYGTITCCVRARRSSSNGRPSSRTTGTRTIWMRLRTACSRRLPSANISFLDG